MKFITWADHIPGRLKVGRAMTSCSASNETPPQGIHCNDYWKLANPPIGSLHACRILRILNWIIKGRPCSVAMLVSGSCRYKFCMGADQISGILQGLIFILQWKTSMYEIQGRSCSVAMLVSGSCRCKLFIRFLEAWKLPDSMRSCPSSNGKPPCVEYCKHWLNILKREVMQRCFVGMTHGHVALSKHWKM